MCEVALAALAIELCYWRVAIDELIGPKRNISGLVGQKLESEASALLEGFRPPLAV